MIDYQELKRLAEAARYANASFVTLRDFSVATSPAAVLAMVAEVEALRKDAERYRWLMKSGLHTEIYANSASIAPGRGPYICIDLPSSGAPNRLALGSGADGYIDAAMSKESGQ